jgi:tetratricopeptide (TPR) repeat protein
MMLEAALLRVKGDTDGAFKLLAEALEISPNNPVVRNELVSMLTSSAQTLRRAGQLDEAAQQYQTALQLDGNDFWSLYYLVELGMRAGQTEFAGQVLSHALSVYPDSPLMLSHQAKYVFSAGDQKAGFDIMREALRRSDPRRPRAAAARRAQCLHRAPLTALSGKNKCRRVTPPRYIVTAIMASFQEVV